MRYEIIKEKQEKHIFHIKIILFSSVKMINKFCVLIKAFLSSIAHTLISALEPSRKLRNQELVPIIFCNVILLSIVP